MCDANALSTETVYAACYCRQRDVSACFLPHCCSSQCCGAHGSEPCFWQHCVRCALRRNAQGAVRGSLRCAPRSTSTCANHIAGHSPARKWCPGCPSSSPSPPYHRCAPSPCLPRHAFDWKVGENMSHVPEFGRREFPWTSGSLRCGVSAGDLPSLLYSTVILLPFDTSTGIRSAKDDTKRG